MPDSNLSTDPSMECWQVSPHQLLHRICAHDGPLILDFDETLYLRNSTEDFLDGAYPRVLARLMLRLIDASRIWRIAGGEGMRDVWRVGLVAILFPWTWLVWRFRAKRLAARFTNTVLMQAVQGRPDVIVATNGFGPIVATLLAHMGLGAIECVPCRLGFADRRRGKLAVLSGAIAPERISRAMVVTDSLDDRELLSRCAEPCLVRWPSAAYREALSDVFLPFDYLIRVKRPNSRYIWHSILQEDFAFWILASIGLAERPLLHVAGLFLALISFWAIYETGYVDNDRIAERFESDPKLSPTYRAHRVPTPTLTPWVWALICGLGAQMLLAAPAPMQAGRLAAWACVLLATQLCFRLFNRLDKKSRIWLFAPLQLARAAGFMALADIVPMGAAGLGAHVVASWIPYIVYRSGEGKTWPKLPVFAIRLVIFLIMASLLLGSGGFARLDWATAAAFGAWNLFRARREVLSIVTSIGRIDAPAGRHLPESKVS